MATLKELKQQLFELQEADRMAWEIYGSELCTGHMLVKEKELEDKIKSMGQITTTSEKILDYLKDAGHNLSKVERETIREMVYDAVVSAYNAREDDNGCNCGQPSCPRCN